MKEKLQQLMKSEGLTSSRMAEILGIQPSGISHILAGRNKPGFDLLQKILRRFPRQSGLVAARLRTDVSNRQSEKFLFNERNRRWKWSD